jgi:enediyne biosynthesis protein E11
VTEQANVVADLAADGEAIDRMVTTLDPTQWTLATPSPGPTIAHQIAHLVAAFRLAALAATEPVQSIAATANLSPDFAGGDQRNTLAGNVNQTPTEYLAEACDVLLSRRRTEWARVQTALGALPPSQEVPRLVRPIAASILAAVEMMELRGHGQNIADALGIRQKHTDRIGHAVAFAVGTRDFGYHAQGLNSPDVTLRFELIAPSGQRWEFGPAGSRGSSQRRAAGRPATLFLFPRPRSRNVSR